MLTLAPRKWTAYVHLRISSLIHHSLFHQLILLRLNTTLHNTPVVPLQRHSPSLSSFPLHPTLTLTRPRLTSNSLRSQHLFLPCYCSLTLLWVRGNTMEVKRRGDIQVRQHFGRRLDSRGVVSLEDRDEKGLLNWNVACSALFYSPSTTIQMISTTQELKAHCYRIRQRQPYPPISAWRPRRPWNVKLRTKNGHNGPVL